MSVDDSAHVSASEVHTECVSGCSVDVVHWPQPHGIAMRSGSMDGVQRARLLTLQGQLIQENVLAEELQKAEAKQEGRLRQLEAEAKLVFGEARFVKLLIRSQCPRCSAGYHAACATT